MSSSEQVLQRSIAKMGLFAKIGILVNLIRLLASMVLSIPAVAFKSSKSKPPSFRRYFVYNYIRGIGNLMSVSQLHYLTPSADTSYHKYCKMRGMKPSSEILEDGTVAHWIGPSSAKTVIINFHGGGYTVPPLEPMVEFIFDTQEYLYKQGKDVAVLFLSYDLAPEARYPRQLQQAASLIQHVTKTLNRDPSNIILCGDSAGGNLVLSLLSHISHPHPDTTIPRLSLSSKFRGAILVSPWVSFATNTPAFKHNAAKDMLTVKAGTTWSSAFLGTPWPHTNTDNYNEAIGAPEEWWNDIHVDEVLITGGKDEILIDSIAAFAERLAKVKKETTVVLAEGEAHDMPSMDFQPGLGYQGPGEQARMIRSWALARL